MPELTLRIDPLVARLAIEGTSRPIPWYVSDALRFELDRWAAEIRDEEAAEPAPEAEPSGDFRSSFRFQRAYAAGEEAARKLAAPADGPVVRVQPTPGLAGGGRPQFYVILRSATGAALLVRTWEDCFPLVRRDDRIAPEVVFHSFEMLEEVEAYCAGARVDVPRLQ